MTGNGVLALPMLRHSEVLLGGEDTYVRDNNNISAETIDGSRYKNEAPYLTYNSPESGEAHRFSDVKSAIDDYAGTEAKMYVSIALFPTDKSLIEDGKTNYLYSDKLFRKIERMNDLGYDVFVSEA